MCRAAVTRGGCFTTSPPCTPCCRSAAALAVPVSTNGPTNLQYHVSVSAVFWLRTSGGLLLLVVAFVAQDPAAVTATAPKLPAARSLNPHHLRHRVDHDGQQALQGPTAPMKASTIDPVLPSCPGNEVPVARESDLSTAASTPGTTYLLESGTYTISNTINLNTLVTCYRGQGLSKDSVKIQVTTADSSEASRAFTVSNGAKLALQNLLMDGQDKAPGIKVLAGSVLEANSVTLQRLRRDDSGAFGGAAVHLQGGKAIVADAELLNNICVNCYGGAFAVEGGAEASLESVGLQTLQLTLVA